MPSMPAAGLRASAIFFCGMLLLTCAAPAVADPKPLTKEEQGKVDEAIDKGVAFLKKVQTKEGDWPRHWPGRYVVAQCALPAYALLESGVPANDPVIEKAATFLRRTALKTSFTYELSLALLFFDRLGDPNDKKLIQSLGLRLLAGQCRTGGWSYRNPSLNEKHEVALLKSLEDLSKQMEKAESAVEAIKTIDVPRSFRQLTVFQDLRAFDWRERGEVDPQLGGTPLIGMTDNSNTQFAILGLWAAQRHGVPMGPTFRLVVERFERSQRADGRWLYSGGYDAASRASSALTYRSITCAGLLALAVGRAAKSSAPRQQPPARADMHIIKALAALYQEIGLPRGAMEKRVPHQDLYFLWSLERVGMLYNLPTVGDRDWYRWGAEVLVTTQLGKGSWPGASWQLEKSHVTPDYGDTLNTAFALLFLKRSHPMKDLTAKLPFRAKELNQEITRLIGDDKYPAHPTTTPSQSKDKGP
jgi:hypothetical protein